MCDNAEKRADHQLIQRAVGRHPEIPGDLAAARQLPQRADGLAERGQEVTVDQTGIHGLPDRDKKHERHIAKEPAHPAPLSRSNSSSFSDSDSRACKASRA
jgi:hypothetical protein